MVGEDANSSPLLLPLGCLGHLLAVVTMYALPVLHLASLAAVLEHLAPLALLQLHLLPRLVPVEQEAVSTLAQLRSC